MESTSIDLNRSRIRFSDIQLEEIAKRNFTGRHYTVIDIQPLLLFLLFYAIIDSSVTSPHKCLLISLMSVNFQHTHLDLILTNGPYKGTISWFWSSTKQLLNKTKRSPSWAPDKAEWDMKNYADESRCYPPQQVASKTCIILILSWKICKPT